MNTKEFEECRKAERKPLKLNVTLFMDSDITQAESINVSDSGISVVTKSPLIARIQIETNGKVKQKEAQLVWARKITGEMEYGLEYTSSSK